MRIVVTSQILVLFKTHSEGHKMEVFQNSSGKIQKLSLLQISTTLWVTQFKTSLRDTLHKIRFQVGTRDLTI